MAASRTALATRFSERTTESETLDDLNAAGDELRRSLRELASLNRWLGGRATLLSGVKLALASETISDIPRLIDVGCGSGDGLRMLAQWSRETSRKIEFVGIDANPNALELARELSQEYPEIEYVQANALSIDWNTLRPDIITANLFCHHLSDSELRRWLVAAAASSASAIVINDLQRSWLPHALFLGLCTVLGLSAITKHDGSISVRRGFTRSDLVSLGQLAHPLKQTLRWRFAFRYQLVTAR
jgi:SAM-dependent methyltransferase